jgi:hypothetical protein
VSRTVLRFVSLRLEHCGGDIRPVGCGVRALQYRPERCVRCLAHTKAGLW